MFLSLFVASMLSILPPEDPLLRAKAQEVPLEEISSQRVQDAIDQMLQIARGEREDFSKAVMVGLAAPQVGVSERIILVDVGVDRTRSNLGELRAYINPQIVWQSEEEETGREGCYSVDSRIAGLVPRAAQIKIVAYDRLGERVEEIHSGFTARIFQHEIDHLEGFCFPDRVGEEGILHWIEEGQLAEYRLHWEEWPHRLPWSTWLEIRGF